MSKITGWLPWWALAACVVGYTAIDGFIRSRKEQK